MTAVILLIGVFSLYGCFRPIVLSEATLSLLADPPPPSPLSLFPPKNPTLSTTLLENSLFPPPYPRALVCWFTVPLCSYRLTLNRSTPAHHRVVMAF